MLAEVKKCAESSDIKGLRYIFVDCLDVDPTFEKYKADYDYCKGINGLFEPYAELTALVQDETRWNMKYWEQLKLDLMKNFSLKRFEHMVKVAKIVYSDKILRLISERGSKQQNVEQKVESVTPQASQPRVQVESIKTTVPVETPKVPTYVENQEKRLDERKRALELENQRVEAEQRAQRARIETAKREELAKRNSTMGNSGSKKWLGIVLAVIVIVVIVLLIKVL